MVRRFGWSLLVVVAIAGCSNSAVSISIEPTQVTVVRGGTAQFQAKVIGSGDKGIAWRVQEPEGGTIDPNGKYTAPDAEGTFHVVAIATANKKEAVSTVTVVSADVRFTATIPASPANNNEPLVTGTAPAGAVVNLFSTADCSGPDLGTGTAEGDGTFAIRIQVEDNTTTEIYGRATMQRELSKCSTSSITYVEDSTGTSTVAMPVLVRATPAGPSREREPIITGTAEVGVTVQLFFDAVCETALRASATTDSFGAFSVPMKVNADTTTTIHARAVDASNHASPCSTTFINYVHDGTPPAAPTFSQVLPAAVANDNSPRFVGTAEAGSLVKLFSDPGCVVSVAQGSASEFGSSGITVSVADDQQITVYATATDAVGNTSPCSTTSLTYQEDSTVTPPAPTWRGPTSRIEFVPGTSEVFITINGQRHRPVFVSVNPQAIADPNTGWPRLLAQIDLASQNGMPIIDLMLGNKSVAWLQELSQHLGNRQVYLWLRFDIWIPELASVGVPQLESLSGSSQPGYKQSYALSRDGVWSTIPFFSSLEQKWLDVEKQALEALMKDIGQSGIGDRVIGVRTTYMAGGEWFQPPLAFHNNTLVEDPPNAWSWSHPNLFSVGDYSANEKAAFAQWLSNNGYSSSLPFPTPADRINPRLGRTFAVDANGTHISSALYRRFTSERVAEYQSELGKVAKTVSQSKALVMVNNAYLYSIPFYNGSYHTAFEKVLTSPYIDAISSPYNYNTLGSRLPGFALIPHGPMDSPALHNKLWIHEDDSRPYWANDGFGATTNATEDHALLLRNGVTSLIHGNALYYFDLPNKGWFGGDATHASETQSLYTTLSTLKPKLAGQLNNNGPVKPEVAIFIDDHSYHLYPEFGLDGAATYGTATELMLKMVEKITKAGAPVRHYLLDDLGNPNLDVSSFKAVFFINTPRLSQAQRQQIRNRLMNGNRVLYFQHVSGLFDETFVPSWSLASEFCPGVSSLTDIENSSSTAVTLSNKGAYTIAYAPKGADANGVASILTQAGVHRYASNAVVDGAGSVLMVHATGGAVPVQLKTPARLVDMVSGTDVCTNCTSTTLTLSGPSTRVFNVLPPVPVPGAKRLFRYEFQPGSYGGCITTDEVNYCSLADGNALAVCGFSVQDYVNSPIVNYGQLSMTYTGECICQ